jgi:hypothetical protein
MLLQRYKIKIAVPTNAGKLMPGQVVSPEEFLSFQKSFEDRFELETVEADDKKVGALKEEGWFEPKTKPDKQGPNPQAESKEEVKSTESADELDVDALKAEYEELFGEKPHHLKKAESIREDIEARKSKE